MEIYVGLIASMAFSHVLLNYFLRFETEINQQMIKQTPIYIRDVALDKNNQRTSVTTNVTDEEDKHVMKNNLSRRTFTF